VVCDDEELDVVCEEPRHFVSILEESNERIDDTRATLINNSGRRLIK
jgi:hypothetical protein